MFRYLFYLLQTLFLIVLLIGYFSLSEIDQALQRKYMEIRQEKSGFQEAKKKLFKLKEKVKQYKIRPVSKAEAEALLLSKADKLYKQFKAQMVQDITVENDTISLKMKLRLPLYDRKTVQKLFYVLENSKSPIIDIKKFDIENNNGTYLLNLYFDLIQVFKG